MNNPSFTAALANLGAQPLGRSHLVSLHALAHCECGEDIREHARRRFHTLTAAEQRRHAAHVLTHPDLDAVDHLMFILSNT